MDEMEFTEAESNMNDLVRSFSFLSEFFILHFICIQEHYAILDV